MEHLYVLLKTSNCPQPNLFAGPPVKIGNHVNKCDTFIVDIIKPYFFLTLASHCLEV